MKNALFISFLIFFTSINTASAATGSSKGKINKVLWYQGHTGLLITQQGMSDLGDCGRSDYYILDENHPFFKEVYSLILTAHISSHELTLTMDGCTQGISKIKHVSSNK